MALDGVSWVRQRSRSAGARRTASCLSAGSLTGKFRFCALQLSACDAVATIVPRRNVRLREGADPPAWRVARDATLRAIEVQGRYGWRTSSGCSRQSLAENAMFRYKAVFGGKLWARALDTQQVEAAIKCIVLNRMTGLGMPHTVRML